MVTENHLKANLIPGSRDIDQLQFCGGQVVLQHSVFFFQQEFLKKTKTEGATYTTPYCWHFKTESVHGVDACSRCASLKSVWTHLDLLDQCQRVVPHLDGSWQLPRQRHSQNHAVGGRGEDTAEDDAFAECVRHDGRHDDQDGGKKVRGAVEVTQRANLPGQCHFIPVVEGRFRGTQAE